LPWLCIDEELSAAFVADACQGLLARERGSDIEVVGDVDPIALPEDAPLLAKSSNGVPPEYWETAVIPRNVDDFAVGNAGPELEAPDTGLIGAGKGSPRQ
jgi:hypothetical protein